MLLFLSAIKRNIRLISLLVMAIIGYAVWAFMVYQDPAQRPDFLKFTAGTVVGIVALVLRDMPPAGGSGSSPGSGREGGFTTMSFIVMLAFLALTGAALLSGCTTTTASVYQGYYTQAKAGVQVWDDNSLKTMRDILCAQPYSAIQRHPELQAGIVTLCGPLTNTAALSAEQLSLVTALYKQLGLQPAAIALPPAAPASR